MSIDEIEERAAAEARIHQTAIEIRRLLDSLADIELPERDPAAEAVALATED